MLLNTIKGHNRCCRYRPAAEGIKSTSLPIQYCPGHLQAARREDGRYPVQGQEETPRQSHFYTTDDFFGDFYAFGLLPGNEDGQQNL